MNYKKANIVGDILGLTGAILLVGVTEISFFICYSLFLVAGLLIKIIYYRCPYCRKLLPMRSLIVPKYCGNCGKRLADN